MIANLLNYIVWDPDPILAHLGPMTIRYYSTCWMIGLLLGYLLMSKLYKQQGLSDEKFSPLFLYIFLGVLIGGRLGHCIFYQPEYFLTQWDHFIEMLIPVHQIVDIAGLVKGASKGEGLGNKFLGNIRECDAIIHVIRCFDDDNIVREGGAKVDPLEDKSVIDTELQLKDLETIESQLTKQKKTAAAGNKDAKTMVTVLEAYKAVLEQGKNARGVTFETKEEQKVAHDLFLLTTKPVLYVANVDEASAKTGNEYSKKVEEIAKEEGAECMVIAAKTEEDIASLETYEDKLMFLEELGLEESGVNRLIKKAYALLNLETFITAGEMEVKAWTYHKGWKAPQCAGVIHTDFEKGFIRAEVIKYDDYIKYGSEAAVREAGKLGIEGKEYVVQDGDIMHFRFNV
jgi:ribosome-binding ATPase